MKRLKLSGILCLLLQLFISCNTDDWKEGGGSGTNSGNGFTLSYTIDGALAQTKATVPATNDENTINSLFILFFESSTSGTGTYKGIYEVGIPAGGELVGNLGHIEVTFDPVLHQGLSRSETYNLLVCANVNDFLELDTDATDYFKDKLAGRTENYAVENMFFNILGTIEADKLPMSASATKKADQEIVEINLIRTLSRFDVVNNDTRYELISVSVWNVFPTTSIWSNKYNSYDNIIRYNDGTGTLGDDDKGFLYVYPEADTPTKTLGGLYAFENYVISPELNDEKTTCLIIGLKKQNEGVLYYRVNINATQLGQQLKRNNVYKTTINRVIGDGDSQEKDAFSGGKLLLDVDINGWNVDDNGSIQFDGENILAVPSTKVIFTPGGTDEEGGSRDYSIFTYGSAKLEISKNALPEGITVSLSSSNILSFTATASEEDKEGYIELSFGNLKTIITVIQTGKTSEFLELSVTNVPAYPSKIASGNSSGIIQLSSSGSVSAEIFCNDAGAFSFSSGSPSLINESFNDGDTFEVFSHSNRTEPDQRYGFVLVTLDSNPSISRVLVLTQNGAGGVSLSPTGTIEFDVFGMSTSIPTDNFQTINVTASDGDFPVAWDIIERTGNTDKFILSPDPATNTIMVKSIEENLTVSNYSATYRVYITGQEGSFKEFTVRQYCHSINVDPSSGFGNIPTAGGTSTNITVTSSANWKAVVTTGFESNTFNVQNMAYFDQAGSPTQIMGSTGDMFKIGFGQLTIPLVEPVATITVTVLAQDGITESNVKKSFSIKQTKMPGRDLTIQPRNRNYGSMASNASSSGWGSFLRNEVRNSAIISNNGPIYMPTGYQFIAATNSDKAPDATADIYQTAYSNVTSSEGTVIKDWWDDGNNGRVLFITQDANMVNAVNNIGLSGYSANNTSLAASRKFTFASNTNRKLIDYLLQDGPFTQGTRIDESTILFGGDGVNCRITGYPPTFVPLLVNENNVLFGIDPSTKLIICGDCDIFGTNNSNGQKNYNNESNVKFMRNFIAWMTYAAMYGDDFTTQFID